MGIIIDLEKIERHMKSAERDIENAARYGKETVCAHYVSDLNAELQTCLIKKLREKGYRVSCENSEMILESDNGLQKHYSYRYLLITF